jgi:hypothetical protein
MGSVPPTGAGGCERVGLHSTTPQGCSTSTGQTTCRVISDAQRDRHGRLVALHGKVLQLVLHESRFVLDRTNTFLLTTSFLFAAFGISYQAHNPMSIAIPIVGLALSLVHPFLIARTISALEFWRSTAGLVETDPDYWYPGKTPLDADLDFTSARVRFWQKVPTRQVGATLRLGRPPKLIMRLHRLVPDPNTLFSTWIPMLVGILWALALTLAVVAAIRPGHTLRPPGGHTNRHAPAPTTRPHPRHHD